MIAYTESRTEKPTGEEISLLGAKVKTYLGILGSAVFKEGVLYRDWARKVGGHRRYLYSFARGVS